MRCFLTSLPKVTICTLAFVLATFADVAGQPPEWHTSVSGILVEAGTNVVVVQTEDGKRVAVRFLTPAMRGPTNTHISVSGQTTVDALDVGMHVGVNGRIDWANLSSVQDATVTLYMGARPTERPEGSIDSKGRDVGVLQSYRGAKLERVTRSEKKVEPARLKVMRLGEEATIALVGVVVSKNPLRIETPRVDDETYVVTINGKQIGPFQLGGQRFQVSPKPDQTVRVAFGSDFSRAGPNARVSASLKTAQHPTAQHFLRTRGVDVSGIAEQLIVNRADPLTAADLKPAAGAPKKK